jgi:hypothetical protein
MYIFEENASEIQYVVYKHEVGLLDTSGFSRENAMKAYAKTYQNQEEIIKNMTKDIIMCDYLKQDYHRPEPQQADYLGIRK